MTVAMGKGNSLAHTSCLAKRGNFWGVLWLVEMEEGFQGRENSSCEDVSCEITVLASSAAGRGVASVVLGW